MLSILAYRLTEGSAPRRATAPTSATSLAGGELARLQNDIRAKVDQRIAEKRAEFDKIFNQKKEEAMSQLHSYESLVNQNLSLLDNKKKDLNAAIEQAKKKGLQDALKGLFKK